MGLGSASTVTLAEARAERDRWRKVLTEGRDPIEARAARHAPGSPQALTSGKVVEDVGASASDRLGSLWRVRNAIREWPLFCGLSGKTRFFASITI
jgi:hypothetical protein